MESQENGDITAISEHTSKKQEKAITQQVTTLCTSSDSDGTQLSMNAEEMPQVPSLRRLQHPLQKKRHRRLQLGQAPQSQGSPPWLYRLYRHLPTGTPPGLHMRRRRHDLYQHRIPASTDHHRCQEAPTTEKTTICLPRRKTLSATAAPL